MKIKQDLLTQNPFSRPGYKLKDKKKKEWGFENALFANEELHIHVV